MDLRISIVSYNTRDLLDRCLASIAAHPPTGSYEVVVVDNGSADDSVALVRERHPDVRLVDAGRNLGYAAGNNLALDGYRGRYFLVLNSDIEVRPGALQRLVEHLDEHPDCGLAGARLILPGGAVQASCAGRPTLWTWLLQQLGSDHLAAWRRLAGQPEAAALAEPTEVYWLTGACLAGRGELLRTVGGMAEDYFMYWEDVDWCHRIRAAGWGVTYLPDAVLDHHHGASSRRARAAMIAANTLGAERYFQRYHGRLAGAVARWIGGLGAALRWACWSLAAVAGVDDAARRAGLFAETLVRLARRENRP